MIRIMDFGIARSLAAKGVTEAGMIIGTPDYMSPEQVEGMEADARSDIYALGATLYEMVTGRVPFEGDTALIIAMKHKAEIPLSPKEINPQLSEELTTVILKCLEKDREKRYQTAEELLAELRCLEEGLPTAAGALKPKIPAFLSEGAEEAPVKAIGLCGPRTRTRKTVSETRGRPRRQGPSGLPARRSGQRENGLGPGVCPACPRDISRSYCRLGQMQRPRRNRGPLPAVHRDIESFDRRR